MKFKPSTARKLRYGSSSVAITALLIAAIIILNVICTMLVQRYTLYLDLTPEPHFTISEECFTLIGSGDNSPIAMLDKFRAENKKYNAENGLKADDKGAADENVCVNIVFLREYDTLISSANSEYVVRNAEELAARFPDYIKLDYVDALRNPSRLTPYLSSNTETIDFDSVIISCGSEYRIRSLRSFFIYQDGTAFAYNAEKAFASSILAVTRVENPLACYTINHGESFPSDEHDHGEEEHDEAPAFLTALQDAGFDTRAIDLSREELPEECRILVVFDPKQDFLSDKNENGKSEIDKLDDFLAARNALMVFMSPDSYTGKLENLEEFLAEWGLGFRRDDKDPYIVTDTSNSIMGDRSAVVGSYGKNELAKGWTASMTSGASAPSVVFPNSTALTYDVNGYKIDYPSKDKDGNRPDYTIAYNSTYNRTVYDLFTSYSTAKALAGGREIAAATEKDPLRLMAVSVQTYVEQEHLTAIEDSAYVLLCGSTDFASEKYLSSNSYGNSDLLLSTFQMAGREPVPVGLKYKEFANYTIDTVTTKEATQYILVLAIAPILISAIAGVFVIVRRKNR